MNVRIGRGIRERIAVEMIRPQRNAVVRPDRFRFGPDARVVGRTDEGTSIGDADEHVLTPPGPCDIGIRQLALLEGERHPDRRHPPEKCELRGVRPGLHVEARAVDSELIEVFKGIAVHREPYGRRAVLIAGDVLLHGAPCLEQLCDRTGRIRKCAERPGHDQDGLLDLRRAELPLVVGLRPGGELHRSVIGHRSKPLPLGIVAGHLRCVQRL